MVIVKSNYQHYKVTKTVCGHAIDHRCYTHIWSSYEIYPWKNSGFNGIRTHDLCDTGAVLYQLSYQASWELVTLWVSNKAVEGEQYKWIYERSYIWTAEKDINEMHAGENNWTGWSIAIIMDIY